MARLASAALLGCLALALRASDLPPALASLADTERAFARTSVEQDQRTAFLAFFADDGLVFGPHPVVYKQAVANRPAGPATSTLAWEPVFGDVSAAGDLGYTTGPYRRTARGPRAELQDQGYFFSIWRKQPDGRWRVALDLGIQTPAQEADALRPRFQPAARAGEPAPARAAGSSRETLLERERAASREAAAGLEGRLSALDPDARLHRNGSQPVLGREAIRAFLAAHPEPMSWTPREGAVAASGDLGYTYGGYELRAAGAAEPSERGYYVHVWKLAPDGEWRIVADLKSPLPPGEDPR